MKRGSRGPPNASLRRFCKEPKTCLAGRTARRRVNDLRINGIRAPNSDLKHEAPNARTPVMVMDALTVDVAAAAACIVVAIAALRRKPRVRRSVPPPTLAIARLIRELRRRHRRVARAIVELAYECLERHPASSFEAFTARETLRSYLPETLAAYLAVPRVLRRVRRAAGPSADDELSRQLRTLHNGLERIREADAEIGATRMTANGAFLDERFTSPDSPRTSRRRSVLGEFVGALETALRQT